MCVKGKSFKHKKADYHKKIISRKKDIPQPVLPFHACHKRNEHKSNPVESRRTGRRNLNTFISIRIPRSYYDQYVIQKIVQELFRLAFLLVCFFVLHDSCFMVVDRNFK